MTSIVHGDICHKLDWVPDGHLSQAGLVNRRHLSQAGLGTRWTSVPTDVALAIIYPRK